MVLVPLLVVGLFSAYKSSTALKDISQDQVTNVAKNLSDMVQITLADEIKLLTAFSVDPAVIEATAGNSGQAIAKLIEITKKIGNDYEVLYVTDVTGTIQADGAGGSYQGINIGEREYFIAAKVARAIRGRMEEERERGDEFASDSDGSAKIALVAIDRSMSAWAVISHYNHVHAERVFEIISFLDRLRQAIEETFPNARSFIRSGFERIDLNA